jgi:hypothetical protein
MTWMRSQLDRLSRRERRTIAIAAGLLLAAWLALRVAPWIGHRASLLHARSQLATLALARGRAALDAEPAARESLAARGRRLVALAPKLLAGGSTAEASAELSALVGGAATVHRVRIAQQDARADSVASIFTRVVLRVEAEGDAAGVAGWLADLEEGAKLIRVRSLAISASEPAAPPAQAERLRAEVVVEGWASGQRRN